MPFTYAARRRFPEALRKFDQVLNIIPDDVDTLANKAAIAQAQGDLPQASELLAPLHLNPNNNVLGLGSASLRSDFGAPPCTDHHPFKGDTSGSLTRQWVLSMANFAFG